VGGKAPVAALRIFPLKSTLVFVEVVSAPDNPAQTPERTGGDAMLRNGVAGAWNGVEYVRAIDGGVIASRGEIGLAYQEMCSAQSFEPINNLKLNPPTDAGESSLGL
jgi:hypothetical protein